jgi:CubicO group peptidase (beta-lactamase class C family)
MSLDDVTLPLPDGASTMADFLAESATDAIVVLHGDRVVHESYLGAGGRDRRHSLFSVSTSLLGTLTGSVVADGLLFLDEPVADLVPELADSAYARATVRQLLDMTASLSFGHDYVDPAAEVHMMDRSTGWRPRRPADPIGVRPFLTTLTGDGRHGRRLFYCSATTDVLAWVLERATGTPYVDLMGERVWGRIGAEHDAVVTVDAEGAPYTCAGVNATARDLARFGRCILDGGTFAGEQVVPGEWLQEIRAGGDPAVSHREQYAETFTGRYPHGSYRSQWWVTGDEVGSFLAIGIHGQYLWLDPTRDVVIAKLSSLPDPRMGRDEHVAALSAIAEIVGTRASQDHSCVTV